MMKSRSRTMSQSPRKCRHPSKFGALNWGGRVVFGCPLLSPTRSSFSRIKIIAELRPHFPRRNRAGSMDIGRDGGSVIRRLIIDSPKRSSRLLTGWEGFFPYYAGYPESFAHKLI